MDRDSLIAVAEDLEYLAGWGPEISDADIRRGTAVLRRLLVEDAYGNAWRAMGQLKQPRLLAVDLHVLLGENIPRIMFALAAGANFRGMHVACMLFHEGTAPYGAKSPPIREGGYPCEREYTLSEYLSSASGIVDGRVFHRREVIKYIANVKGGVHLSARQRKAEEKLIARLGKIEKKMMVHNSDGLLVEAVAIGQALGGSEDAQTYISLAKKI